MKKIGLLISLLLIGVLLISGCTSPTLPQPTPSPSSQPTPSPGETILKFWTVPEIVSYDSSNGWVYRGYVSVEGNEPVTLTRMDLYERETENSNFVFKRSYSQAEIASWPAWKTYLSPEDTITFVAGYYPESTPPYQKKFVLYGITDSGKTVSAEAEVIFLPK